MEVTPKLIKIISVVFLLLMTGLMISSILRYNMYIDTITKGEGVKVKILKVNCSERRRSANYFVFNDGKRSHIVNFNFQQCSSYSTGDSTLVLYNQQYGLYFVEPIQSGNEKLVAIISGLFAFGTLIYLIFPKFFSFRRKGR